MKKLISLVLGGILSLPIAFAQSVTGSGFLDTIIILVFSAFVFIIVVKILRSKP